MWCLSDQDWISDLEGIIGDLGDNGALVLHMTSNKAETVSIAVEEGTLHLQVSVEIQAVLEALVADAEVLLDVRRQCELSLKWLIRLRTNDIE